jgi:hypothetical protein
MNPIVSIYKLMGFDVSLNISNADEEDSQSIMELLNSIKDDNIRFKYKITELKNEITRLNGKVLLEEENTRLNGRVSFLEKECLYSSLDNQNNKINK